MTSHDTDHDELCPDEPPCEWAKNYVNHMLTLKQEVNASVTELRAVTKDLVKSMDTLERRLEWQESNGERTMRETVEAKAKDLEHEARITLHESHLAQLRETAAQSGADAGRAEAVRFVRAKTKLYLAAAALLAALVGVLPTAVQSCSHQASASPALAPSR